jgi:septal ring factor EnvC (AmiA/AmiB activator)
MRLTRRKLAIRCRELEERLAAAKGETRKEMRERLARTTGELAEAQKQLGELPKQLEEQRHTLRNLRIIIGDMLKYADNAKFPFPNDEELRKEAVGV